MIFIIIAVIVIFVAAVLYLISIRPNTGRQKKLEPFCQRYIAHRGLFDNEMIPENSLTAFKKATEHGYAIELDVQVTSDDIPVVFHDESLSRMCGSDKNISDLSYKDLYDYNLSGSTEMIPTLKQALDTVNGEVPLVIEIKPGGRFIRASELTNEILRGYKGEYCIESFNPFILRWFKKHNPDILRGQLSSDYIKEKNGKPFWQRLFLSSLMTNFIAKPDFIAYNHKFANQFSYRICRKLFNVCNFAWTVRNQNELDNARNIFQAFIFDSFIPE